MKRLFLLTIFLALFLTLLTGVQTVNASEQKWYQPPEFAYAALRSTEQEPVVADDWRCTDPRPVTDVHFWGAYKGWLNRQMEPPTVLPPVIEAFMVRIYADVPAGADPLLPYSHPGELLYDVEVNQFTIEYITTISISDICVSCDTEHKYYYSLDLPEPFNQDMGSIYWIAISAMMPDDSTPWGWETSTIHWNDNACRYWLANGYWEELLPGMMPSYPVYEHLTVDMAFALTVGEPGPPSLPEPIKWCQLPDMEQGINIISHPGPDMPTVADDWLCLDGSPVSDLHFWGSYPGWFDNDPEPPSVTPGVKGFRIQIYSDRPATAAGEFSRPDKLLYEVWVENFQEHFVASIPINWIPGVEFEHKYRYDLDLPRIFWQLRDRVYWLNIAALPLDQEILWGWENSMERWNDYAVEGWYEDLSNWFWEPVIDPYLERYLDMSFALTTCPGPAKWLQLPDMAKGRNIISQAENPVVADDFLCTNGKPILEVCFWGSYLSREGVHWQGNNSGPPNGFLPDPPPVENFKISFHEDIPAGVDPEMPWSHPGGLSIEEQRINNYEMRYWDSIPHYDGSGHFTWWEHKYYYKVQLEKPFFQEEGRIYWLDIGAQMRQPEERWRWGWETSKEHWNDVAVKGDGAWWDPLGLVKPIGFEDLLLNTVYVVGNTFMTSGTSCSVQKFQWSNGNWSPGGFARVDNGGQAGGSGQELAVNNVNIALDLLCPAYALRLLFGEYGGNVNLRINGDFRNEANFQVLDGQMVGNVLVSVIGTNPGLGVLKFDGLISDFAIGGQELWIDEISGLGGCDMAFMLITEETIDYCEGDFYRDGDVDGTDLFILCQDYGRSDCHNSGDCEGDFNYNGTVLNNDLGVFAADYGRIDCPCHMPILPR